MQTLPAPGVLSITGKGAELVIGEGIVQVTVVGVVEHGFDALSEKVSTKFSRHNRLCHYSGNVQ